MGDETHLSCNTHPPEQRQPLFNTVQHGLLGFDHDSLKSHSIDAWNVDYDELAQCARSRQSYACVAAAGKGRRATLALLMCRTNDLA